MDTKNHWTTRLRLNPSTILADQLVVVTVYFEDETVNPKSAIIHRLDSVKFIEACLELHFSPGLNPLTDLPDKKAKQITIRYMKSKGPQSWARPGLGKIPAIEGVEVYDWGEEEIIWEKP